MFLRQARKLYRLARDRSGVTGVEYGIAAALMSAALVAFLSDLDDASGLMGRMKLLYESIG